jgi:hypothetical protein
LHMFCASLSPISASQECERINRSNGEKTVQNARNYAPESQNFRKSLNQ